MDKIYSFEYCSVWYI